MFVPRPLVCGFATRERSTASNARCLFLLAVAVAVAFAAAGASGQELVSIDRESTDGESKSEAAQVAAPADRSWSRRQYRVQLQLIGDEATLTPVLSETIRQRVAVALGSACLVDLYVVPHRSAASADYDKQITIELTRYEMTGREIDLWIEDEGPTVRRVRPSRVLLPTLVADFAAELFRPRLLLRIDGSSYEAEPWGHALDRDIVAVGDLARPVLRFETREGAFRDTRAIPWTLLEIESVNDLAIGLALISGYRAPVPERVRRGEAVALVERPLFRATELLLTTQDIPTAGLEVRATTPGSLPEGQTREVGQAIPPNVHVATRSDRFGRVRLPAADTPAWVWVDVKSETVLARVPVGVGLRAALTVPLTDDAIAIGLTERMNAIRADLTDAFASRVVLLARAKKAIKNKEWALVRESFEEIDKLPDADTFLDQLNTARVEATEAAGNNRAEAARARLITQRLARTVRETLDERLADDLKEEAKALEAAE